MSKSIKPRRGRRPTKRLDVGDLSKLMRKADGRIWTQLAVVRAPEGASSHWDRVGDSIYVDVETVPRRLELRCRLGTSGGSLGHGLWRVPAEGTEVLVAIPDGEIDFTPTIVAVLDSGAAPAEVSDDVTVLVAPDEARVVAPDVKLGTHTAAEAVIKGTSYRNLENQAMAAVSTWITAVTAAIAATPGVPVPLAAAVSLAGPTATSLLAAFVAAPNLSTIVKTG